jgi:hypothetical protein
VVVIRARALFAFCAFVAATVPASGGAPPSSVLVPTQRIPLHFSHVQHLVKAGVTCTFCHTRVAKSTKTSDRNIPGHPECDECHDRKAKEPAKANPPAACETCHAGYSSVRKDVPLTADMPAAYIRFPHSKHAAKKIACATCHGDFVKEKVGLATVAQLPKMTKCLTCHDNRQASAACKTCHLTNAAAMVVTEYPTGVLKPSGVLQNDRHDAAWLFNHRASTSADRTYCANCHTEQYCQDCHNGVMKPLKVHPGDFVSSHAILAKSGSMTCDSCHRDQSFCVGCHQRMGVGHVTGFDRRGLVGSPRTPAAQRFHPLGWVSPPGSTGRANQHGFEAQRNIRQCTGCHTERSCAESCHRSAALQNARGDMGQGFNPHGPRGDFLSRCGAMLRRNRRACYKCHTTGDANLARCR